MWPRRPFGHFHCNRIVTLCPPFAAPLWRSRRDGFQCSYHSSRSRGCSSCRLWRGASLLVFVWFFGGGQLGPLVGLPPAAADAPPIIGVSVFWSRPFIWFYIYFAFGVASSTTFWRFYSPHPWWQVVDPRLCADPVHDLFPGAGERGHQRLVRPVLRSDPGGAVEVAAGRRSGEFYNCAGDLCRHRLRRCHALRSHPLLRQPLHLPLAHRDERLLHGQLGQACATSKAPRSASRKIRCASPRPWRGWAST